MHGPGSGSHTPGGTPQAGYGASASGTPAHGISPPRSRSSKSLELDGPTKLCANGTHHSKTSTLSNNKRGKMVRLRWHPAAASSCRCRRRHRRTSRSRGLRNNLAERTSLLPRVGTGQSSTQAASQPSHDDVQLPGWQPLTPQSGGSFAGTSTPPQQQTAACAVGTGAQGDATAVCAPAASRPMQSGMQQAGQMMQNAFRAGMARLSGAGMQGYAQLLA